MILLQSVVQPLESAFEYRHAVERSLAELNEICGLAEISNVKQCVRKIAHRLHKANLVETVIIRNQSDVSFVSFITINSIRSINFSQIPVFEYSGASLPELSRQSVVALEEVSSSGRYSCSLGVKERPS